MGLARLLCALGAVAGCIHAPAIGRGGPVYAISVESINGRKTANRGSVSFPACAIQVGDRVAQVWLAYESRADVISPVVLEGDAVALKDGILVERSWTQAIVHKVTDEELAVGAAVVYVPGSPRPTIVELRFEPVKPSVTDKRPHAKAARRASVDGQDNLSKRLSGF
jgi:hypothetical protein